MKTICANVLTFALKLVRRVCPRNSAKDRRSVTEMSRTTIIQTIHHGTIPSHANATNAADVSTLSASGSRKIPHLVTFPVLRAIQPSYKSVNAATAKTSTDTCSSTSRSLTKSTTKSGVNMILRIVSWFGNVILKQFKFAEGAGQVIKSQYPELGFNR